MIVDNDTYVAFPVVTSAETRKLGGGCTLDNRLQQLVGAVAAHQGDEQPMPTVNACVVRASPNTAYHAKGVNCA